MSTRRKTVRLPSWLVDDVEAEAARQAATVDGQVSFSDVVRAALVVHVRQRRLRRSPPQVDHMLLAQAGVEEGAEPPGMSDLRAWLAAMALRRRARWVSLMLRALTELEERRVWDREALNNLRWADGEGQAWAHQLVIQAPPWRVGP